MQDRQHTLDTVLVVLTGGKYKPKRTPPGSTASEAATHPQTPEEMLKAFSRIMPVEKREGEAVVARGGKGVKPRRVVSEGQAQPAPSGRPSRSVPSPQAPDPRAVAAAFPAYPSPPVQTPDPQTVAAASGAQPVTLPQPQEMQPPRRKLPPPHRPKR